MANANRIDMGGILGGFRIERELGRGGMGVVYKGHELSLNRKVALKVLSERLCSDEEFIKRFKREAQVIAALEHPNIVNILSYGEEQGLYYFAMEYVRGRDLGQILKEKGSISLEDTLSIGSQVASALAEAGSRGVVHRDLKPSNIMVDDLGRAKVTDFGVAHFHGSGAKLTQTGLFLGTPEYASPEQATGKRLDVRSDIYALGAVLYRMLSGKPPITGESPLAVVTKIATETVTPIGKVNADLPKRVCDLIDTMMAKEVGDRFQTPEEVVAAMARCVEELDLKAPLAQGKGVVSGGEPMRSAGKYGAKFWGGIAGVALAVLLIVWLVEGGFQKEKEVGEQTGAQISVATTVGNEPAKAVTPEGQSSQSPSQPLHQGAPAIQEKSVSEKSMASFRDTPKEAPLPAKPTVLMIVTGNEGLAPLVQSQLESLIGDSGLPVASVVDIPSLYRKAQFGDTPITWQSVRQFVPAEKAQIIVLGQVDKTGTMDLKFYGRVQEMTTATFSAKALDVATGTAVARSVSGSIQFTQLNMQQNIQQAVTSAAGQMGAQMKAYWKKKLKDVKG